MATKCIYCNSSSYGSCTKSPHKQHKHNSDGINCIHCGARYKEVDGTEFVSDWKKRFAKVVLNEQEQDMKSRDATHALQSGAVYEKIGGAWSYFSYNLVFSYEDGVLVGIKR